jgi:hypothetical protein
VEGLLLAAFSQIYSENCEKKDEPKGFKNLQFGKKIMCKIEAKEFMTCMRLGPFRRN